MPAPFQHGPGVELDNIQYISQITKFSKQLQTT